MAKLPPVHILAPTIVRYTFKHVLASGPKCDNVVDISIDASDLLDRDGVVDDLNSHVMGWWQDSLLQVYSSLTTITGANWIDLDSVTGRTGTLGPAAGHPTHGAQNGPFTPPNNAYLLHKAGTSARGRKPGRMYLGDVAESLVDDRGNVSAGQITSVNAKAEQFRSTIRSYNPPAEPGNHPAAWRVVHVHKVDKLDPSTWTWSSSDVNSATCDPLVASQRRRNR